MYQIERSGGTSPSFSHHLQPFNVREQECDYSGGSGVVLCAEPKPRLRWSADLHQRFVDAVTKLGGADKATPKSLMKVMNVKGLTLYHLKSHLQKYRLGKQSQRNNSLEVARHHVDEESGGLVSLSAASCDDTVASGDDSCVQISEALRLQMEVQRKLREQLEVQRLLQLRIEAQARYLQSILEKAQHSLAVHIGASDGLEAARAELLDLTARVSSECLSSGFSLEEQQLEQALIVAGPCPEQMNTNGFDMEFDTKFKRQKIFYKSLASQNSIEEALKVSDCELRVDEHSVDGRLRTASSVWNEEDKEPDAHVLHRGGYEWQGGSGEIKLNEEQGRIPRSKHCVERPTPRRAGFCPENLFRSTAWHEDEASIEADPSALQANILERRQGHGLDLNSNGSLIGGHQEVLDLNRGGSKHD